MLVEQYLISLNFQAGSLPVSPSEQPKVSSAAVAGSRQDLRIRRYVQPGRSARRVSNALQWSRAASDAAGSASSLPSLAGSLASNCSKGWKLNYI